MVGRPSLADVDWRTPKSLPVRNVQGEAQTDDRFDLAEKSGQVVSTDTYSSRDEAADDQPHAASGKLCI